MSARGMTTVYRVIGSHLHEIDPGMFARIADHVGSRSLTKVGGYVHEADPDMFHALWQQVTA